MEKYNSMHFDRPGKGFLLYPFNTRPRQQSFRKTNNHSLGRGSNHIQRSTVPTVEFFSRSGKKNPKKKKKNKQNQATTGNGNDPSIAAVAVAFGTMPPPLMVAMVQTLHPILEISPPTSTRDSPPFRFITSCTKTDCCFLFFEISSFRRWSKSSTQEKPMSPKPPCAKTLPNL